MRFLLRMAWRESRFARRRLLLYSSTVVIGIAALVAVGSLGTNLRRTVGDQPRRILGADLTIGVDRWPSPELERFMQGLGATEARARIFPDKLGQGVRVIALEGAYPFYGDFTSEPAGGVARLRRGERVVILDPALAQRLHLAVGDPVRLGSGTFALAGVVRDYPGDSAFTLQLRSRVFLPWSALPPSAAPAQPAAGNYVLYFRLPAGADAEAAAAEIKSRFHSLFAVVNTPQALARRMEAALDAGDRFFSLIVFVALLLGGIGVAGALHAFVHEKLRSVAILRCLGSSAGTATGIYLCQVAALGLCGSAGGAVLGVGLQAAGPALLRDFFPFPIEFFLAWKTVAAAAGAGFLLCLVFALLPLLAVRRVPPLAALRAEAGAPGTRDPWYFAVWAAIAVAVTGFAWWETRRLPVALGYAGGLALVFAIFAGAARLVASAARRFPLFWAPYPVRQGVANLHRPRNRTTLLLLSLGLGLFIVLTVYLARGTLLGELRGENTPNLILGQIPDAELSPVLAAVRAQKAQVLEDIPSLSVSLESVNGRPWTDRDSLAGGRPGRRLIPHSLQATYRSSFPTYENLISGSFVGHAPAGAPIVPVSLASWLVGPKMPLHLGDEAVWQVEGVPVRTRVASVHQSSGFHLEPTFPLIFPAGALEGAPHKSLLLIRAPSTGDSAAIQRAADGFRDIRVVDLALAVETVQRVFAKIAIVVDFIAFFTLGTGIMILASTVVTGRHQRARETVLLRALGATRAQMRCMQLTEYALMGGLSAVIGGGLALLANLAVARFILHLPPAAGLPGLLIAALAVTAAAVVTGAAADRGLANLPPLQILREEG